MTPRPPMNVFLSGAVSIVAILALHFPARAMADGPTVYRLNLSDYLPRAIPAKAAKTAAQAAPSPVGAQAPLDYRAAFETALHALYDNGGGVLEVNPGVYEVCGEIRIDPARPPKNHLDSGQPTLIVRGAGGESQGVTIQCSGEFKGSGKYPAFFKFRGGTDSAPPYSVWMEHLSIGGRDSAGSPRVAGVSVHDKRTAVNLRDMHFRNLRKGVFLEESVGRFVIDYCKFYGIGEYALDVAGSGDGSISRCDFSAIGSGAESSGPSAAIYAKGNTVISENIFGSCAQTAIRIRPDYSGEVTVTHNEFDRNALILEFTDKRGQAGKTLHWTTNCEFSGNKVVGWHGIGSIFGRTGNPIQIGYIKGSYVSHLKVLGNSFAGLAESGIGFDIADGSDVRIADNSFSPEFGNTWQPILGTLFRFSRSKDIAIYDNLIETGWMRDRLMRPRLAEFEATTGELRSNRFLGWAGGVREDAQSRMEYAGNAAPEGKRRVFADSAGWMTVPDEGRILSGEAEGKAPWRRGRLALADTASYASGRTYRLLTVGLDPGAGQADAAALLRVRVWVKPVSELPAYFEQTLRIARDNGGMTAEPVDQAAPPRVGAGKTAGRFSLSEPKGRGSPLEIRFAAETPKGLPYAVSLESEWDAWGAFRLK
jgi:hypothetical protein